MGIACTLQVSRGDTQEQTLNLRSVHNGDRIISKESNRSHSSRNIPAKQEPCPDELERAAATIDKFAFSNGGNLKISISTESNQQVVKVISKKDGRVISQFPSEELLRIAADMKDSVGIMINKKA